MVSTNEQVSLRVFAQQQEDNIPRNGVKHDVNVCFQVCPLFLGRKTEHFERTVLERVQLSRRHGGDEKAGLPGPRGTAYAIASRCTPER